MATAMAGKIGASSLLFGALLLSGCSTDGADVGAAQDGDAQAQTCSQADQVASWPAKRRVAQVLMGGVNTENGEAAVDNAITAIAKGRVGGINFLGNASSTYANNELAQAVDAGGPVPPFLAIDEEGGRVQRLEDLTGFVPSPRQMAQTLTPRQVENQARDIGRTMRSLSLNMDLAPIVDVSDQEDYEVIGDRSFGDDPAEVTDYAGHFARGLRDSGVIPVLKHFPGLGSGTGNTDFQNAYTPPLADLQEKDLVPYESLLADSPVAVMTTNAIVPDLSDGAPASLSRQTYRLLRDDYGFDGVVMTDSLSAAAITYTMDIPTAAEKSLQAGADIALWDGTTEARDVRNRIVQAVRKGRIPRKQLNRSVERVLELKGVDLCAGR